MNKVKLIFRGTPVSSLMSTFDLLIYMVYLISSYNYYIKEVCYLSFYFAVVKYYFCEYDVKIDFKFNKTIFGHQFIHFKIKTRKVMCTMQVFKGTIFCCVRSPRGKCYNIFYFSEHMFFLLTSYFSSAKDLGAMKIVSHILKILSY